MSELVDPYGRKIKKMRISLLDACNLRCFYCMPEKVKFMPSSRWLSREEIFNLSQFMLSFGLEQIRLTGGEPLLRPEFIDIVRDLSELNLKKLGLTTNGIYLEKHLKNLSETDCRYINISLDSLEPKKFHSITKVDVFDRVMASIFKAKEMGFYVKINTVLMKGINENEVMDFIQFSKNHQIEVRFLEMMKIGQVNDLSHKLFISAADVIQEIKRSESLKILPVDFDSTSVDYATSTGARIGFIASETQPFCGSCSRLRLSPEGKLRACLMSEKGKSIKGLRDEELYSTVLEVMSMKPINRIENIQQNMYEIGG